MSPSRRAGWNGFIKSENFTLLALAAEKFGSRPSRFVGLVDPVVALDFDLAAATRLLDLERAALDGAGSSPEETPPPALRCRDLRW